MLLIGKMRGYKEPQIHSMNTKYVLKDKNVSCSCMKYTLALFSMFESMFTNKTALRLWHSDEIDFYSTKYYTHGHSSNDGAQVKEMKI